jgi:2-polyprenyl-3-methyl-5-hydroxy-6-metoxy-1,4-benzoquinol methylase
MFGSEYSKHPEILFDSFRDMGDDYKKKVNKQNRINLFIVLQKIYIRIFGIPEIGFQVRSMFFKKILSEKMKIKPKKILDAGSGIGINSFWLSRTFSDSQITGWEIDKNKLEFSKKFTKELNIKNVEFAYQDISKKIKKKMNYDLIINTDVLEHINDYKGVLKNFYAQLSKNGYLYIHTPQINQKRIIGFFEKWQHEDHVREGFEPKILKSDLEKLGFKIVVVQETFGYFGKLAWELNHLTLMKSFVLAGLFFPFFYCLAKFDLLFDNKEGLGIAILARKG